jgi:GR25 family glycosyltransferase involved in LPS biosynthesis
MSLASILVVLIQTPGSPRANPLINILEGSQRIQLSLLPATMIQNLSDVREMNIEVRQDHFNLLENRDMRPQEIGCAHSHNSARDVISNSLYGGVILEDDARISDLKNFIDTVTDFLMVERGNPSVLNLTGLNFHKRRFSGSSATQLPLYLKIFGQPSLAVGYALTAKAARVLREANTPIASVSDARCPLAKTLASPESGGAQTASPTDALSHFLSAWTSGSLGGRLFDTLCDFWVFVGRGLKKKICTSSVG